MLGSPAIVTPTLFADLPICERARDYSVEDVVDTARLPADLAGAVRKRQVEFLAGRDVAARALAAVAPEHAQALIGRGAMREPLWPAGIVGSITHATGYVAAAVARAGDCLGLGIDSERIMTRATADDVATTICRPAELQRIGASLVALTAAFSAKESLYKCLAPLVREWFAFHDAEVDALELSSGRFSIRLLRALGADYEEGWRADGRLVVHGGRVHTGIALPAPRP